MIRDYLNTVMEMQGLKWDLFTRGWLVYLIIIVVVLIIRHLSNRKNKK